MTLLTADAKAPGGMEGSGSTLVVEHTTDNKLMAFRFKNQDVSMLAAEDDFELDGRKLPRRRVHHSQCRPRPPGAACSAISASPPGPSPPRRP